MSNNLEVIMKKRKELNICIISSIVIFSIYFYYYLSMGSFIWRLYSIFVLIIMLIMVKYLIKVKPEKLKSDLFPENDLEGTASIEYPITTFLSSSIGLIYISMSILQTIIEKTVELRNFQLIIYVILVVILFVLCTYFTRKYIELHTLIYKNGLRIYSGDILFTDIKKYNFLKLKKSGYSFEINLGGEYHRFKVAEEQKWRIIELLEMQGVA